MNAHLMSTFIPIHPNDSSCSPALPDQDGFTYERHAIQSALTHRWRSPMTGCDMGDTASGPRDDSMCDFSRWLEMARPQEHDYEEHETLVLNMF